MHVSIDFGFHKLATMPPSRPSDNSLMVTKVLGSLLSTKLHSQSLNNIRGVGPWGYSLGSFGTKMDIGHGFSSYCPNSHVSWLFPLVLELLPRSLLHEQYQNPRFPVR